MLDSSNLLSRAETALHTAKSNAAIEDYNAAVNRAYYAMFNAARSALMSIGQQRLALGKTHSGIHSAFSQYLILPGHIEKIHGHHLGAEGHRRIIADYDDKMFDANEAAEAIANAQAFVSAVAGLHFDDL